MHDKRKEWFDIKRQKKGNETSNFRPITCLSIMWKVFTGILAEQVYRNMEREKILPEEQKGCEDRVEKPQIS